MGWQPYLKAFAFASLWGQLRRPLSVRTGEGAAGQASATRHAGQDQGRWPGACAVQQSAATRTAEQASLCCACCKVMHTAQGIVRDLDAARNAAREGAAEQVHAAIVSWGLQPAQ